MTLLTISNIAAAFGAEDVLEGITAAVNAGDRIGLVGRNGAGKTTLLRVLAGDLKPLAGERHVARGTKVALVEQVPPESTSNLTVHQEALGQLGDLLDLEDELQAAALDLQTAKPGAAERYAALQHRFEAAGGFTYQARLDQVLTGLGFSSDEMGKAVSSLSGGQRSRLGLAKALLAEPDLLLMDEPTNHLDFGGLQWLEDFLRRWPGTLVVTSHDRYFLDRVANRIWSLDGRHIRKYRGNYTTFHRLRGEEVARRQAEFERQQEFIAKEEAFIRRYRAGQRAREARGRATRLARLDRVEAPSKTRDAVVKLASSRTGEVVLSVGALLAGYEGESLLDAGDLEVERGARIALLGPNGTGKTTLLRTLAGELAPVQGTVALGVNVRRAHYWQEAEDLDPSATVLEELVYLPGVGIQEARDLLGMMLFRGTDVDKPVSGLSGGERSRLALARLVLSRANLLLLDEPTNHLDIPSREALEAALQAYQGTIIFASHDRRLISTLANRLWLIEDGRLRRFDGTFEEYEERQSEPAAEPGPRQPSSRPPAVRSKFGEKQRAEAMAALEAEIEGCELELTSLGSQINDASARGDLEAVSALGSRHQELESRLKKLIERWSDLQA